MNIKKVDDKPMVIHTKEKPKVHVRGTPETKIKGRNILTVQHGPKIAGSVVEKSVAADGKIKLKRSSVHVTDKRKTAPKPFMAQTLQLLPLFYCAAFLFALCCFSSWAKPESYFPPSRFFWNSSRLPVPNSSYIAFVASLLTQPVASSFWDSV